MIDPAPFADEVHVAAAVLRDARGHILLAQRTADRRHAGLWEFPGGKCEPGEAPRQALSRELHEELGIRIDGATPLIAVPFADGVTQLLLDVYEVTAFGGEPHGREGQALAWVEPAHLADYPMPPADLPVVAALTQPDRYLITPPDIGDAAALSAGLGRALADGIRRVQLRLRGLSAAEVAASADIALRRCTEHGAELLLNSAMPGAESIAAALGCGLHLTESDLRAFAARPTTLRGALAASCHDAVSLRLAEEKGCDFAVLGPVAATASHRGTPGIGWSRFREIRSATSLPVYALGGLVPGHLATARGHGAQGIAAIRGLWQPA